MSLHLHNLKPARGARVKAKRVGRGLGSGHGNTSTRGMKGQRARTGGKGGLKYKGMRANILNVPQLGGFRSLKPKLDVVNVKDLEKHFQNGEVVNFAKLVEKGLLKTSSAGIKVLGMGKISKKLIVKVDKISESARALITKAGGEVHVNTKKPVINKKETNKA